MSGDITVKTVSGALAESLARDGFVEVKRRPLKLMKSTNPETDIFVFPNVERGRDGVFVDPIMGVYNGRLRQRAEVAGKHHLADYRVCTMSLCLRMEPGYILIPSSSNIADACELVVRVVNEIGMPLLAQYDSLPRIRQLLLDDLAVPRKSPSGLSILYPK